MTDPISPRPEEALPEGIVAVPVMHYRVGHYLYTSFADAKAEHKRRANENASITH